MEKIIALRSRWFYIDLMFKISVFGFITYSFIKNIILGKHSEDYPDILFVIILYAAAAIPLLYYIYCALIRPRTLIVKRGPDFILYCGGIAKIKVPIIHVVSVSRENSRLVVNTNERGYHITGVARPNHVIALMNETLRKYKELFEL